MQGMRELRRRRRRRQKTDRQGRIKEKRKTEGAEVFQGRSVSASHGKREELSVTEIYHIKLQSLSHTQSKGMCDNIWMCNADVLTLTHTLLKKKHQSQKPHPSTSPLFSLLHTSSQTLELEGSKAAP